MTIKVGINGFGRIGRVFFRIAFDHPEIEIVGINDLMEVKTFAHLLKYDSTFGRYQKEVAYDENNLYVDGKAVRVTAIKDPTQLPWKELGVDVVVESTGIFKKKEQAMAHVQAGAKKVILSAPGKDDDITLVYGVNHTKFDPAQHTVISNASCTTNGLAPSMKVLDEEFGIVKGLMCTVHAYTNDQVILDRTHSDLRRARSAACSIIPTTTGAAKAVALVLPQLKGKLNGFAMRVPVCDVSIIDVNVQLSKPATAEEVNAALKKASEGELKGVLGYSEEPLVSSDYLGMTCSGTVDALSTMVIDDMVKLVIWYDNEWSYCSRLADIVAYVGERL